MHKPRPGTKREGKEDREGGREERLMGLSQCTDRKAGRQGSQLQSGHAAVREGMGDAHHSPHWPPAPQQPAIAGQAAGGGFGGAAKAARQSCPPSSNVWDGGETRTRVYKYLHTGRVGGGRMGLGAALSRGIPPCVAPAAQIRALPTLPAMLNNNASPHLSLPTS